MLIESINATVGSWSASASEPDVNITLEGRMSVKEYSQFMKENPYGTRNACLLVSSSKDKLDTVKPKFGGMITLQDGKQVYIKRVIYSKPCTIVFWSDGVKTKSTCAKEDIYNGEFGLSLCVMKRFMSSDQVALLLEDWFVEEANDMDFLDITLKDLRERDRMLKKFKQ